MDLHDGDEAGVQVVRLGLLGVQDLHGVRSPGDGEDGSFVEVLGELDGVQRGRRHDELHVRAFLHRLGEGRGGGHMLYTNDGETTTRFRCDD